MYVCMFVCRDTGDVAEALLVQAQDQQRRGHSPSPAHQHWLLHSQRQLHCEGRLRPHTQDL